MLQGMGWRLHGEVWGDANAVLGVIHRNGFGKARPIELLWVPQVAAEQRLKFAKALGTNDPTDLYTKYLDEKTNFHHTRNLDYHITSGRPENAPRPRAICTPLDEYQIGGNGVNGKG